MQASEFDNSKYLNSTNAKDLNNKTLVIYEVKPEIVREVRKMAIGFESVDRLMIVNKTNRQALTAAWGDDTDSWVGKSVTLSITSVMFEGKLTPSILLTPTTTNKQTEFDATRTRQKSGKK